MDRNCVSLLSTFENRTVIPVRALPFLEGWDLDPQDIALGMGQIPKSNFIQEFTYLFAYRISDTGPVRVRRHEWRDISEKFSELAEELPLEHPQALETWSIDGLRLLPPATFFWLDEFMGEFSPTIDLVLYEGPPRTPLFSSRAVTHPEISLIFEGFPVAGQNGDGVMHEERSRLTREKRKNLLAYELPSRGHKRRLLELWDEIEERYGPNADGRQAKRVLDEHSDPSDKKPELKTVRNHLIELRKIGLIP